MKIQLKSHAWEAKTPQHWWLVYNGGYDSRCGWDVTLENPMGRRIRCNLRVHIETLDDGTEIWLT